MVRKNKRYGRIKGGASTSKKQKTSSHSDSNPEDSPSEVDDLTLMFRSRLLPRSYPMPTNITHGMRLVNTFEDCFENLDGNSEEHPKIKLAALSVSQSVVSLASFKGEMRLFACTGTIIECRASKMSILTSASLVRCDKDETKLVDKLKIKVHLPNGKFVEGKLWKFDLHYNIAVVNIKSFPDLHTTSLCEHMHANFQFSRSKLVAIGRCFESGELMATAGTLLYNTSKLDCQELVTSTCKITKAGIGGPLIGSGGNFIGMNFYAKEAAPFLPISIILKCMNHFEIFGRVLQPWLGLRTRVLQDVKLGVWEEIHNSFPHAHGIYVERVIDGSPAAVSGITVGDLITKLDGVALFDAQQFHELILDKADNTLKHGKRKPLEVSVQRPRDGLEFIATINAELTDLSNQNRWPVSKTRWRSFMG